MKRVRTAVIPVAGLGTRFLPVTKAIPKEMLPLVDRPCIEYVVAEAVSAGIERIVFVTSRGKDALVDYFDRSPALEQHLQASGQAHLLEEVRRVSSMAQVVTIRQRVTRGLGHAILTARPAVGEQPFAVLLGDDVIDDDGAFLRDLVHTWEQRQGAVVALLRVPMDQVSRYGICAGPWLDPTRMDVHQMVEKPSPEDSPGDCSIVGRYVLPPEIFDILDDTPPGRGGEVQITDAIAVLAARRQVTGQLLLSDRFDTGNVLGFIHANLHFARKRPELRPQIDAMLEALRRH